MTPKLCTHLSIAVGLAIALAPKPAPAQAAPIPGSYLQSCGGVSSSGATISANQCKNNAGSYHYYQTFDTTGCRDDIRNIDGNIACSKGDAAPPEGSYKQSCVQISVMYGNLYALCKTPRSIDNIGTWQRSNLSSYKTCHSLIANRGGRLSCG